MTTTLPTSGSSSSSAVKPGYASKKLPPWIVGSALMTAMLGLSAIAGTVYLRYGNFNLTRIPLKTEAVKGFHFVGKQISFTPTQDNLYTIEFDITQDGQSTSLELQNIDLSLMIPQIPASIRGHQELTQWFLTEREFNRQRVFFAAGSPEINLPNGFMGYKAEDLSISVTNNCLGAGYWELAIYAQGEQGKQKIYQGYFDFPKGAYSRLITQFNQVPYWNHAPSMESWPGFNFYSGMPFDLDALRTVKQDYTIDTEDLKDEKIIAINEQVSKANLMVIEHPITPIETWQDLQRANPKFQSFVPPGVYNPDKLWKSDYSQIAHLNSASAKTIDSQMSDKELLEIELLLESNEGKTRKFIMSGIDWNRIPQVAVENYDRGIYLPIGFAPTFTDSYANLKQNPPQDNPFFSVMLDGYNLAMHYRKDIGINGFVMHRDIDNPNKLHFYFMSYERITLVNHYVLDLTQWVLAEHSEPESISAIKEMNSTAPVVLNQAKLNQKVYTQLDQAWQQNPRFNQSLAYQVFVDQKGLIAAYQPTSKLAEDWVDNTPLSDLSEVTLSPKTENNSLESFQVVFTPRGGIEVNPWWGWE